MHGVIADAARANDRDRSSPPAEMPVEIAVEPDEGDYVRADHLESIEKFLKEKLPAKVYEVGRLAIIAKLLPRAPVAAVRRWAAPCVPPTEREAAH